MAMWPLHQRLLPCKSKFAAIQAARALFTSTLHKPSSIVNPPPLSLPSLSYRSTSLLRQSVLSPSGHTFVNKLLSCSMGLRLSHGTTNLVISEGKVKFETHEIEPPKKEKRLSKKRFKMKLKKEKQQRKAANKRDPRKLTVKRDRKRKFANAEERIMYKLERARIKEALLIERLKRYEVSNVQGPEVKPHDLTGEERFYLKKMAQKRSNYVPVGRRGVFGGVILNMHMHWKKHETVEVICKPCKPGQVQEYAKEIARLSGGIPIQIIGDDTIIFYRGKDYVQPEVMSPIDTLSKKKVIAFVSFILQSSGGPPQSLSAYVQRLIVSPENIQNIEHLGSESIHLAHFPPVDALEKSKYEQSLESVRRFIAISEKELELYYRHIALYGDPSNRNPLSILDTPARNFMESGNRKKQTSGSPHGSFSTSYSETEADSSDQEATDIEDDFEEENVSTGGSDSQFECTSELDDKEEGDTLMAEVTSSKQYKKKTYDVLNL